MGFAQKGYHAHSFSMAYHCHRYVLRCVQGYVPLSAYGIAVMGERRVFLSHRLINQQAFDRELIAMNKASTDRMLKEAETLEVGFHMSPLPRVARRYIPIRERSLHSLVKGRSLRTRRSAGRQAGVNHGRMVTFRD